MDVKRGRSLSAYKSAAIHEYKDLDSFLRAEMSGGIHTVDAGGYKVDILFEGDNLESDFLLVFFTAAITSTNTLPFFSGRSVARQLGVPLLAFSDPCLGVSTRLGAHYYMGDSKFDYSNFITEVVRKYGNGKRVIFAGASGAGFPALLHGSRIPNSLSFVMNPVTNIMMRPSFMINGKRLHFAAESFQAIAEQRDVMLGNSNNYVLYVQNVGDQTYFTEQMVPYFVRNVGNKRLFTKFGHWGEGHYAMPSGEMVATLQRLMDANNWGETLSDVGQRFQSLEEMLATRADLWNEQRK